MKNKYKFFIIILLLVMIANIVSMSYASSYTWQVSANIVTSQNTITNDYSQTLPTVADIENNNSLNLTSGAGILIEQSTGQVLYAHNIHEKLRPASVTKVMTILLIMEQIDKRKFSIYRYNCMFSKCKQHGRFTNMVRSERTTYSR